MIVEVGSHDVVCNQNDKGSHVIETTLMAIGIAIIKEIELDHVTIVAAEGYS